MKSTFLRELYKKPHFLTKLWKFLSKTEEDQMGEKNQRFMLTKRLLKDSLIRFMSKKEPQKITISELCKDAGINRATFYNHYNTPYGLLREIEMKMVKEIHNILIDFNINEPTDFSSELIYMESPWYDRFLKNTESLRALY